MPVDLTWCVFPSHTEGSGSRAKECSAAVSDPERQELSIEATHNHGTVYSFQIHVWLKFNSPSSSGCYNEDHMFGKNRRDQFFFFMGPI